VKVLFIHQNFPGQYRHLAAALAADSGNQVVAVGDAQEAGKRERIPGVHLHCYESSQGATPSTHAYIRNLESGVRRGQQVCRLILKLRAGGFVPDVICCHPGWGEGLYVKDVYPNAKVLGYFEFFYHGTGADVGFDPEFPESLDDQLRVRTKNTVQLLSLASMDWGISPTRWQWSLYPPEYRQKISVIFDGIDTDEIRPAPEISVGLAERIRLTRNDEVITFVSRALEPYRGIHTFIRALPELLRRRPNARVIVVGTDQVSYGKSLEQGSYRRRYLDEIGQKLDLSRVHFTGWLPRHRLNDVLQLSSVHVYLTYPFVLSWSMLEAMSTDTLVIGSRTAPVQEIIEDGRNGLLVDFFQPLEIADAVDRVLSHPDRMQCLRDEARRTIQQNYDLKTVCLPKQLKLLRALADGRFDELPADVPEQAAKP